MYISVSDRNGGKKDLQTTDATGPIGPQTKPFRMSPVILSLGLVSMLTDVSSESVSAILPLYITGFLGLSTIAFKLRWTQPGGQRHCADRCRVGFGQDLGTPNGWPSPDTAFPWWPGSVSVRRRILGPDSRRDADRIGKGIRTAPRDALITVSAQPEYLARHFGVHRMLDNIGAASGPLLAFFILMLIPNGYGTVFVVSLAFAAIGVAVLTLLVPNLKTGRPGGLGLEKKPKPAPGIRWSLLREPGLRRLLVTAGVLGLLTVGDGFIYLSLQHATASPPSGSRCSTSAPTSRTWSSRFPSAGWPTGSAGRRSSSAATSRSSPPTCRGRRRPTSTASTCGALLLLGAFYAATDGVLAALVGRRAAAETVRAGHRHRADRRRRRAHGLVRPLRPPLVHRRPRAGDPGRVASCSPRRAGRLVRRAAASDAPGAPSTPVADVRRGVPGRDPRR